MQQITTLVQEQEQIKAPKLHPIGLYLKVWLLLFVLSACSYMVDYFQLQGYLRWSLLLLFMVMKAGLIMAIFMHLTWERRTVKLLFFVPLSAILVFIILMAVEADYTFFNRLFYFVE